MLNSIILVECDSIKLRIVVRQEVLTTSGGAPDDGPRLPLGVTQSLLARICQFLGPQPDVLVALDLDRQDATDHQLVSVHLAGTVLALPLTHLEAKSDKPLAYVAFGLGAAETVLLRDGRPCSDLLQAIISIAFAAASSMLLHPDTDTGAMSVWTLDFILATTCHPSLNLPNLHDHPPGGLGYGELTATLCSLLIAQSP
jgi:hypothetical protein